MFFKPILRVTMSLMTLLHQCYNEVTIEPRICILHNQLLKFMTCFHVHGLLSCTQHDILDLDIKGIEASNVFCWLRILALAFTEKRSWETFKLLITTNLFWEVSNQEKSYCQTKKKRIIEHVQNWTGRTVSLRNSCKAIKKSPRTV